MLKEDQVLLSFIIDKGLRDRFMRIAKANDETASRLLRGFVKDYLSKNAQGKLI